MAQRTLTADYLERVYAGVLGKIIGVYLGRPFEGWTYDRITKELGDIEYYVHEQLKQKLIVTDDDISGTFTFLRALEDTGCNPDFTPQDVANAWMNYLIEERSVLWWGGLGCSTEHTAYLRLKNGVPAPASGSIAVNGQVVAEQIGAQIFIDGWGMVCPGDPVRAADFARRAGSVSHDGEAIYGAQVVAAMIAQAFVEPSVEKLIETGLSVIPADCLIAQLINDLKLWRAQEPDWRKTREKLEAKYGYEKYGGGCHMIPNHGVIHLALLYGDGDFSKSLSICNTAGWDTDCNSANVGAIMGVATGLAGINSGPDWRGPVADRVYLPTADAGRCVSDAATEAIHIANMGRALHGLDAIVPKDGAKFHFSLPGSVQGFREDPDPSGEGLTYIVGAKEGLAVYIEKLATGRVARVMTPTFLPPEDIATAGYANMASPTLYSGQTVKTKITLDKAVGDSIEANLVVRYYLDSDKPQLLRSPAKLLVPNTPELFEWKIEGLERAVIQAVGVEARAEKRSSATLTMDWMTWDGAPTLNLSKWPEGELWRKAWVDAMTSVWGWTQSFTLVQNAGTGLFITGGSDWTDYTVETKVKPHMVKRAGVAVRVQGMRRWYGVLLTPGKIQLVKCLNDEQGLAEAPLDWVFDQEVAIRARVAGDSIQVFADNKPVISFVEESNALSKGGIALVVDEGNCAFGPVQVRPN